MPRGFLSGIPNYLSSTHNCPSSSQQWLRFARNEIKAVLNLVSILKTGL